VDRIINTTLHEKPEGATHWSTRTLAKKLGVSYSAVHRVWKAHRIQPHRERGFKLSRDPEFNEKVADIVGQVLTLPCHHDITAHATLVPHPKVAGFAESIGEPQGQIADYRKSLPTLKSIHVRLFGSFYKVHWDKKDPHVDPVGHLIEDAPFWGIVAAICVIGLIVGLLSISRE
jgi:hypothetical protein